MPSTLPGETGVLSDVLADASLTILAKLFKNAIDPDNVSIDLTSFTESTFAGYAPVPVDGWGMCESENLEVGEAVSDPVNFESAEGVTPQTVYGAYIVSRQGTGAFSLVHFMIFAVPILIERPGQIIPLQARAFSVASAS